MPEYKILEGSIHEKWMALRTPIQMFGGAYGNGKSSAIIVKALQIIEAYPGLRVLVLRETMTKLDTMFMPEFWKWMPKGWIKSWNKGDRELITKNNSLIHFRYLRQKSDGQGDATSNVIGGNYDLILVDQLEDPGIVEKDFDDLMGRRRGQTPYRGSDPTMPRTGPRWLLLNCNPTGNWVYRKLVRPYHLWLAKQASPDLIVDPETGEPLISIVEGSTYENAHNLPADYLRGLEATYKGQMKDRFLQGLWANYEGLVYPDYDALVHRVPHDKMIDHMERVRANTYNMIWVEGYDHGLQAPSCYGLGFVDEQGILHEVDGFHEKELAIAGRGGSAAKIKELRARYGVNDDNSIWADPGIFRRTPSERQHVVGLKVSDLFEENGVRWMVRGNNDVINGIIKVGSYLQVHEELTNPYTDVPGSPLVFFSDKLMHIDEEFSGYKWKNSSGKEEPVDKDDHAMDMLKYKLGSRPDAAKIISDTTATLYLTGWHVKKVSTEHNPRSHRHG